MSDPLEWHPADLAECRQSLARHARTFHAASLLLPPAVRAPATVLYSFCRLADDAVDVQGGRRQALQHLRQRLDNVYAGRPNPVAADRALTAVVARFGVPRALPDFLIEGLAWDVDGRSYETLDDLYGYAARVAGSVGAMMCLLMGTRDASALARACDLGVAMQLSNIARDVGEDARMGRLYLPRQWLRQAGISPDRWLQEPEHSAPLGGVVRRLLDAADALYERAGAGMASLPLACRPGINAARLMYAAVGHEVARAGCNAVQRRAVVPGHRKAVLLAAAALGLWPDRRQLHAPVLPACEPLLAAMAAEPLARPPQPARSERVVDLFTRLAHEDRQASRPAAWRRRVA